MEKRAHPRTAFAAPVYFAGPGHGYQRYTENRSPGGLLIRAGDRIEPGTELTLCYPSQGISLKMKGFVVRSGERGLGLILTATYSPRSLLAPDRRLGELLNAGRFTPMEQFCIRKYLQIYQDLEAGRCKPDSELHHRFVRVCMGLELPRTVHETAYMKWKSNRPGGESDDFASG